MDEKTEELRDIFMDVSEEATVTETQEEARGSLAIDEAEVDEGVASVVDRMRDRYEFETNLEREALVTVVRGYYEGDDDEEIAEAVANSSDDDGGMTVGDVFESRLALHLFRDDDTDVSIDLDQVRDALDADPEELADEISAPVDAVRRCQRVLSAQSEARQVSHRFQSEFEDVLQDAGLSTTMTASVKEDGLDEATEDIGSLESDADVSF